MSPHSHHHPLPPSPPPPRPPPPTSTLNLEELFHVSMLQLASESEAESLSALHLLERSLVPNPQPDPISPPELIRGVVKMLCHPHAAKPATKVLLALCLAEPNRSAAVGVGAVGGVMEAVAEMECSTAERALAALELMCTVAEGAAELRSHALAVPMMVEMMGRLEGYRGKEYAMSVLAVIYGGDKEVAAAPPEEVARAVALALQGECSARGRRKGALLLKMLTESDRPLDVSHDGHDDSGCVMDDEF
uniref:U-box domain-containing protein n=1 Tax=Kalanchoe fedtschenkoi TaxID=63787 RepID=A0A7N0ZZ75_KALFE